MTNPTALDTALVPSHEHPYPIPANWLWVYLTSCYQNITSSNKKIEKKSYNERGLYPIIDQGQSFIAGYSDNEELAHQIRLPVILFGDHTRCIKYIDFPFIQGADGVKILSPNKIWNPKLFYFAMINLEIPSLGYRRHSPIFSTLPLPLPPLEEQARIVAIIERLFTQLDDAKAILGDILASLDDRKSAILHQAFAGELTQNWRDERGLSLDSWQQKTLGEVLLPSESIKPSGKTFNYIDIDSIDNKNQTIKSVKQLLVSEAPSRATRKIKLNSVLFSMVRPYLKNIAMVTDSYINSIASTGFLVCNGDDTIDQFFLYYLLIWDHSISYLMQYMRGDNSPSIRKDEFESLPINLPPIEEQQEIVRALDSLLSKEDELKNCANRLEHIDLLKKTILARAFRGELSTNNPGEPSCEELLKQMLAAPTPKKERNISIKMRLPKELKSKLRSKLEEDICRAILNKKHAAMKDLFALHRDRLAVMQTVDVLLTKGIIAEEGGNFSLPGER